ncbi:MAG: hypothetical protein E6579_05505 [Clostridium sp.]|nr:hypothetical protein [Clostridium sp.]
MNLEGGTLCDRCCEYKKDRRALAKIEGHRQEARRSGCGVSLHAPASSFAARRLKQGE